MVYNHIMHNDIGGKAPSVILKIILSIIGSYLAVECFSTHPRPSVGFGHPGEPVDRKE